MTEPIQTIVNELKTLGPDITNAVVFKLDGETLAACENTTPEQTQTLIDNINRITQAESIGGIENLTVQDINAQLNLSAVDSVYLATVSSRSGDKKIIKSLTQVVVPAVIRLTLKNTAQLQKKTKRQPKVVEPEVETAVLPPEQEPEVEPMPEPQAPPEPLLPTAPTTQFMVEKIEGILVRSDTVRIDDEVIEKWRDICDDKDFSSVTVETLEGKTVTCKFKSKLNAKGTIQIPERILQALQTSKGKLVMVKPVIEG